jgi:hypothetical protein
MDIKKPTREYPLSSLFVGELMREENVSSPFYIWCACRRNDERRAFFSLLDDSQTLYTNELCESDCYVIMHNDFIHCGCIVIMMPVYI